MTELANRAIDWLKIQYKNIIEISKKNSNIFDQMPVHPWKSNIHKKANIRKNFLLFHILHPQVKFIKKFRYHLLKSRYLLIIFLHYFTFKIFYSFLTTKINSSLVFRPRVRVFKNSSKLVVPSNSKLLAVVKESSFLWLKLFPCESSVCLKVVKE